MPQNPLNLAGAHIDRRPMRMCARCDLDKPQAGGCDVGPQRWICADCWKSKTKFGNGFRKRA